MASSFWRIKWLSKALFVICLLPLVYLAWLWYAQKLGINQIERVARFTGDWTLRFLLITLAITPLRRIKALAPLAKFRRMLGLFAFFYATLHMLHYFGVDTQWNWTVIREDLTIRRFFVVGFLAWLLMVPLAATSFNIVIRRMGFERWQLLHRVVYLCGILGVTHYLLQGKTFTQTPLVYAGILALLLASRLIPR
jgi:methionine sulfoxide reductase heme-binding subunit